MFGPNKARAFLTTALITTLFGVTGCGRRMLKNYSSLAPRRTASLEPSHSTFRSQNELPVDQQSGTTGWAGHSDFPRARLLQPQFGDVATVSSEPPTDEPTITPKTNSQPRSAEQASGGHSLGFTASEIRQRMNERNMANNPVELLPEKPELWQVLGTNSNPQTTTNSPVTGNSSPNTLATGFATETESQQFAEDSPFPETEVPDSAESGSAVPDNSPIVERSVLDRLKGLYDDSESNAKQLFKRNLQRLPNPWNVFREKEQTESLTEPLIDPLVEPFETRPALEDPSVVDIQDNTATVALIAAVETELLNWPRTLSGLPADAEKYQRRQQDLRLLQLIAGRPEEAIASIQGMPGPEQEFWQELMLALAHFRSADEPDREQRLTATATQLRSAVQHISAESALRIRRLEICSKINSFGRIEPFESNEFDPGQQLGIYVELENFGTEMTSRGTQATNFDAQLQFLHHDSDEPIETIELSEISDEATSDRTDYYQSFTLNIPSHLAPGVYRIRLRIRDALRKKQAEGSIDFQVREPPSGT